MKKLNNNSHKGGTITRWLVVVVVFVAVSTAAAAGGGHARAMGKEQHQHHVTGRLSNATLWRRQVAPSNTLPDVIRPASLGGDFVVWYTDYSQHGVNITRWTSEADTQKWSISVPYEVLTPQTNLIKQQILMARSSWPPPPQKKKK